MTETMANATYRGFNYPHQISSYWAMYHVARHTTLPTARDWHWYLHRAGKTALKLGTTGCERRLFTPASCEQARRRSSWAPLPSDSWTGPWRARCWPPC